VRVAVTGGSGFFLQRVKKNHDSVVMLLYTGQHRHTAS
jgi:hypothetical protein